MKKYGCVNLLSDLMVKSPPETVLDKVLSHRFATSLYCISVHHAIYFSFWRNPPLARTCGILFFCQ